MKYFTNSNNIPQTLFFTRNWGNQQSKLSLLARFFVLLFIIQYATFNVAYAQCAGGTPSVMAKWTFDSYAEQCNGAVKRVPNPLGGGMMGRIYPILQVNTATYCPDLNAGCAQTVLGSKGFNNTTNYNNAICLWGFYDLSVGLAPGWVATDPTFHPEIPANLSVWYDLVAGKAGSLTGFSILVVQQQYNGSTVNFEKQGVGVYRNGVLIYSTTQPITAANVNGTPLTFTFPATPEFYSDGSAAVKFEIVFGLVNRLITNNTSGTRITGYDNICVLGTCGASPMPAASISPATCSASGSNTDGKITLSNFGATDHFDYNVGATYTGGKAYASAAAIPAGGIITSSLPNPASPTVYTVRVFSADGCTKDLQVTLNPTSCPVACTPPTATAAPTDATCAGATANNDAKITISGFGATDTYQYSTGATFTAASATPASATVVPAGGVIASALANPAAVQTYTVRIYGAGSTSCYVDRVVSINPKSCTVACTTPTATATGTGATCTGNSPNKDAKITLTGFGATDTYQYSEGSSFSAGSAMPAAATVIPASGIIANTLANPTSPITYTVRIYAAGVSTCFADRTVTITPTICTVPCTPSTATVAATNATCVGTGMNAQIAITGITGGDKVGLSVGSTYTGATYSTAQAATSSYTFSNLPNPQGSQIYTVRIYNGGDNCFKDYPVTITETTCGACKKYGIEIICSDQADANSTVNNSITTEDDFTTYEICKDTKKIDLKLTKTVTPTTGTTCPVGTEFTWTITITNAGDMTATNIQVADFMSPKMIVTASTPNAGTTYSDRSGWLIPSLAGSGATATLTIKTKALVAGTLTNCAEIMEAFPLNDPNSTPANGVITEDDYACASITVTGPNTPEISKEFSPMQTKANIPTRLIIKITNNETTPITTTAALVDNLPSTPAQMVIATTPNLATGLTGVIATAGGTSVTIPSGTVLLPGLNQIAVDVIVPSDGYYCNTIAAGALKTTSCDNVLEAKACLDADVNFEVAPIITKTMLPATIQTGQNAMLTIKIENRNSAAMTLNQDFIDFLPTGLVANGAVAGTCAGVSLQNTNTEIKMASGSSIPANSSCTITVPVTSSTAGSYCNIIRMNSLITTVGTNTYLGNQDQAEACITVTATPCTAIDLTSITQAPTGTITTGATVNLTAVGTGTGASTVYTWSAPSGTFSTQANPTVWTAPTTAGSYTVKVVGNNSLTGYGVCKDSVTLAITVQAPCVKPNAGIDQTVCAGTKATLTGTASTTGTWTAQAGNPAGATLSTTAAGVATATFATTATGTYKFIYNISASCEDTMMITVNAKPAIADGAATICAGESVNLTTQITGYASLLSPVWTVATASGTAVSTPTSVKPTATTTYVLVAQNAAGCKDTANVVVTVNPKPNAGSNQTLACANPTTNTLTTSTTLAPVTTGGTFTQIGTTPAVATIAGNAVSGMTVAGTYQFQYSVAGCLDTVAVIVQPCAGCVKPNAGPDAEAVCQPTSTAKLTAVTAGGTWAAIGSPANPSAATIDAAGNITGLSVAGTYRFVYSVTGGGLTCTDTAQVVVNAKPVIADGAATICAGESVNLTTQITNYASLLSPVWTVATASGTAVSTPTAVKPTATTTYVLVAQNAAGCKDTANVVVTVNPKPNAGPNQTLACANPTTNTLTTSTTLAPTPMGGTWTQIGTTPAVATIAGNNVSNMTVAGTYQFVYTLNGCKDTVAVTVQPCAGCVKPNAGPDAAAVCQPTSTAKLTAVTAGGTWAAIGSPANPSAATIDAAGNITGLSAAGTYRFVYSVTGGGLTCTDTAQVVVNAKPAIADGAATICAGETVNLTTQITNYASLLSPVWTVATASGTAVSTPTSVKPTATTTYVLVAQNAAGCKDTANVVVTVNPKPNAGTDQTLACANTATNTLTTSTTLAPVTTGGTFTQIGTTPAVATIAGNAFSGMTVAGTYQFQYSVAGCLDTVAVIVQPCAGCVKPNAGPDVALTCPPTGIAPTTATLTPVTTGGTWAAQTGNPATATLTGNNVTGLTTAGTYKFIYSVTGGGQICTDTVQVIVPMCVQPKGSLGDFVWKDTNNNGIQDETTPNGGGVAGVQIELYKNGTLFAKDTTDATGKYLFSNLDAGTYKIKVLSASLPAGCEISAVKDAPSDDAKDSDVDKTTGESGNYVIDPLDPTKKDILTVDAGLAVPCVKSTVTLTGAPVCSADVQTYSLTFSLTNKVGIVKVNQGMLTGSNPYTVTGIPSGMTVKITDSLSAVCKWDTLITGPNCNCNPPLPTLITPSLTACIGDTFPTIKATVIGLATVEWFATATSTAVLFTGLNYKPAGNVTAAGATFYAQARSTDPSCPAAISTSRVMATINAQNCTVEVDLALKKSINTKIAQIGDVLTYTLKVWNESSTNATGVEVVDSIATTVQFQAGSFTASRGTATITGNVIKWTIGNVGANGDTVTLTYRIKATQQGIHFNTAEICKANEKDVDSTPCNHDDDEDDIDRQCFTVPIKLCAGEKVQVSVPANLTNVQWFKNGGATAIGGGNVILLTEVGTYTFTATNQTCPVGGCCPVIIEAGANCCPVEVCIPFTVKKRKK